ncbi:cationic outer membrane protein OmpH [Prevotella sp. CAG:1058]|nr:cationic outer membrane protein OmpH [Prevotella sp. CAG:1058]
MNNHHYMRKLVLLMLAVVATVAADAQTLKFGYLSYREAIKSMPGYAVARQNLESLRNQYSEETKRSEEEFNQKYELFLEAQGELAAPILKKRQAELQELLARSVDFKKEASRLLAKAKAEMFAPLHKELDALLARIASERGYAFILNTDGHALPYANQAFGEDITAIVKDAIAAPPTTDTSADGQTDIVDEVDEAAAATAADEFGEVR